MALLSALFGILRGPTIGNVFVEVFLFLGPLWVAVVVGVVVGWAWKPKWATNLGREEKESGCSSGSMAAQSASQSPLSFGSMPVFNSMKVQLPNCISWIADGGEKEEAFVAAPQAQAQAQAKNLDSDCSSSQMNGEKLKAVGEGDLEHIIQLVEVTDGGPAWIPMMDRSAQNMYYQAWRRDPQTGPPQYRSRTVFEDATPEMVRDFFWDDSFRQQAKWDDMLLHSRVLEECPTTGTMVVQWIRKFPFFCSDREYVIGRRIWESGRSYYCVTKGIQYPSLPRHNKPRRVDLYYSSWCIRAAESKRGTGLTACEVILFHHEDMGIPWEIAKLGVRQGMWPTVKKIEPGLRAYQKARAAGAALSQYAFMAQINTKINADYLRSMENDNDSPETENQNQNTSDDNKPLGRNIPKLLVVGGAVIIACSLDRGLVTKAVIFGVARRFANIGRRL